MPLDITGARRLIFHRGRQANYRDAAKSNIENLSLALSFSRNMTPVIINELRRGARHRVMVLASAWLFYKLARSLPPLLASALSFDARHDMIWHDLMRTSYFNNDVVDVSPE